MKRIFRFALLFVLVLSLFPRPVQAQDLYFQVESMVIDVFWNEDGSMTVEYFITFNNTASGAPIDYVDIGLPNSNYSLANVTADVNGNMLSNIEPSPFVDPGIAVGMGQFTIPPGGTETLHVVVRGINRVLFVDDQDENYASAVFSNSYFGQQYVQGNTRIEVTFHLPPGVQPDEPRWHNAPSGFPAEPITGFDEQGRITYTWINTEASAARQYRFGASFPRPYVPDSAVVAPTIEDRLQIQFEDLIGGLFCFGFAAFFIGIFAITIYSSRRRQMQYLPPKIAIEGHGIKRGLTAIEAAILMEQPMDKIMTMILFSVIKKGAAEVTSRDPLELKVSDPLPEGMRPYEESFLKAFTAKGKSRRKAMQDTMVELVKSVSNKMKGFSRKETIAYYEDITRKAWAQVEAAETPEVQSAKYDEVMEWTMLDRNYNDRTREVFRQRPIFVPVWWGRYDPTFGRTAGPSAGGGQPAPSLPRGGGSAMPTLPGAEFAATIATSVQNFSGNIVGNLSDFTSGITSKTNPVPKSSSSGGSRSSGGGGCACACACAGCACACAGGGR